MGKADVYLFKANAVKLKDSLSAVKGPKSLEYIGFDKKVKELSSLHQLSSSVASVLEIDKLLKEIERTFEQYLTTLWRDPSVFKQFKDALKKDFEEEVNREKKHIM